MPSRTADSAVTVPLVRQRWHRVSFLHWRCPPADIAVHLPEGLEVDEYDGSAWLSITPLEVADARLPGLPALPGLSTFPETNLRTYVRGPGGAQGLWFFSLDAASWWITLSAPVLLGVPYRRGDLAIEEAGTALTYTGTRRDAAASYRISVEPQAPIDGDDLSVWLTHRWRAYSRHAGGLLEIPVRHKPWPLRAARCLELTESLTSAAGVPAPIDPLVHYSDGVDDVAFGIARRV